MKKIHLSLFIFVLVLSVESTVVRAEDEERRKTTTGAEFVRDTSVPALGEAWRDESGMIWGDVVKYTAALSLIGEEGSPRALDHKSATSYCRDIGAQLPSREDFARLRTYMGASAESEKGYTPQVLPGLAYAENGRSYGLHFWSSTVQEVESKSWIDFSTADDFHGFTGRIDNDNRAYGLMYYSHFVRCVVRR